MTDSDTEAAVLRPSAKRDRKIYIEHCTGCESHQWCTYHKSEKYTNYLAMVKDAINKQIPDCIIIENDLPSEKSRYLSKKYDKVNNQYIIKYKTKKGYTSEFPRVGAFEVYFKHKTVFSKLKTSMWPTSETLATKLEAIITNMENKKPLMEGITHKDMSESEPEVEPTEFPNPKSSFIMPKVPRRKTKPKTKKKKKQAPKGENVFITNPVDYPQVSSHDKLYLE
jgi:hypothetical protein